MFRTWSISDSQQERGGELPKAILPASLPKAGIDPKTQRPLRQESHRVVMSRRPDLSQDVSGSQTQNAGIPPPAGFLPFPTFSLFLSFLLPPPSSFSFSLRSPLPHPPAFILPPFTGALVLQCPLLTSANSCQPVAGAETHTHTYKYKYE